ncbi:nitroreductase family protein [Paenibacillus sp. GCM10023252]|uniref:nitroreductase family protein n=1 Tax=Paenibacillus sp. GCM10023252 TaxID=3252649 RepID=UPI003611BAAE
MNKLISNDYQHIVSSRRSIRTYDPSVKISREEMEEILTKATLAPSSTNMQPWRFIVIESEEAKATLAPLASFNQRQVETSAAVIAVFGDMNNFEYGDEIYSSSVELGYMPADVKETMMGKLEGFFANVPAEVMREIVLVDGGLVSMQLMLTARAHGYDTNAIGGYDKANIAEAFGLDKDRYVPVMLISIGKADGAGYPSYRLPINKVAEWK